MNFNIKIKKIFFLYLIFIIYISIFFSGCSSSYKYYRDYEYIKNFYSFNIFQKPEENKSYDQTEITDLRRKIVEIANQSLGITSFTVNSRSFLYDCSGFIFYIYYKAGIDLKSYIVDQNSLGGVHQLYLIASNYFSTSQITFNLADIIIFDNTYDRNKNNVDDDPFSHVALIVEIKDDGTIVFIHKSNSGVQKGYMNLLKSDLYAINGEVINSYLKDSGSKTLASQLFNTFATFFR